MANASQKFPPYQPCFTACLAGMQRVGGCSLQTNGGASDINTLPTRIFFVIDVPAHHHSYVFYDHVVSMHMIPMDQVVKQPMLSFARSPSPWCADRVLAVNRSSMPMVVGPTGSYNMVDDTLGRCAGCICVCLSFCVFVFMCVFVFLCVCVCVCVCVQPHYILQSIHAPLIHHPSLSPSDDSTPYLLQWLEAYADALHTHNLCIMPILQAVQPNMLGINLFPQQPPAVQVAITNGVVVKVSTILAPEIPSPVCIVAYSIRLSMLPPDEQQGGPRMESCQLRSRRWRIMDDDGQVVDTVEGEGVVGQYPVLRPGAPEFEYRSCSQQVDGGGWMEGEFEFVAGTIGDPLMGVEPFWVQCPRFSLGSPDVLF